MADRKAIIRRPDGSKTNIGIQKDSTMIDAIKAVYEFKITDERARSLVLVTRRVENQPISQYYGADWPEANVIKMAEIGRKPVTDYLTSWWEIIAQDGYTTGFAVSFV
jgi:hypothetical protein